MKTFVLVHGASHGGWCWARVADRLRSEGHRVHTPILTGSGERSHLYDDGIGLGCHVDDVISEIIWGDLEQVILCGHSYGGVVVSAVADRIPERICAIVYLNAFVAENGQSVTDILGITPPTGPVAPLSAEIMHVNEKDRAWVDAKLTPQPPKTLSDRVALNGAWEQAARKTYILATLGAAPVLAATHDRLSGRAGWQAKRIEAGHDMMIDNPGDLARLLLEA